jgi:hypothetical protein
MALLREHIMLVILQKDIPDFERLFPHGSLCSLFCRDTRGRPKFGRARQGASQSLPLPTKFQ